MKAKKTRDAEDAATKAESDTSANKKAPDKDFFATVRKRFHQAMEANDTNRKAYIEDVMFSCAADQWPEDVKRQRGEQRPALTFNRLNAVIKQIIGDYRQHKLSIKVLAANGDADEDTAEILAGLIRNIEQQSNADMAYSNALECSARGGFGYFRIVTRYTDDDAFEQDLVILPVHNPLTVVFDPSAKLLTREDARWCFVTEVIPKDQFQAQYPDAKTTDSFDGNDDWYEEDGVRIAEYYKKVTKKVRVAALSNGMTVELKDGEEEALAQTGVTILKEREAERTVIKWYKLTGSEILDEREYKLRYIPVIPVLGEEVNLEGKVLTRSAIFYAKDAQRMYNYWKSTATELVALSPKAPWLMSATNLEGFEEQWKSVSKTPLDYILFNPDPQNPGGPQRLPPAQQPLAEMSMALGTADDIKATTGIFNASLGEQGNEISGVAISARQDEGNSSTFIFIDNLKKAIEHCGRVLLDWIPEIYDTERVVRVLDLEGNPSTEVVNQEQYDPATGIKEILNNITVGKYDVVITTGPNFASRRRESLAGMVQIAQLDPQFMQKAGDLAVKALDLPGGDQIAERYKRSMPPQLTVDPDSPEGKQLASQPPPVPPEVQMEQAKSAAAGQLEDKKTQNAIILENVKTQNAASLAQSQQKSQAQQDAEAQRMESQRMLMEMREQAQQEIKKMLLDHKLEMERIAAQTLGRMKETELKAHVDAHTAGMKNIADVQKHAITTQMTRESSLE